MLKLFILIFTFANVSTPFHISYYTPSGVYCQPFFTQSQFFDQWPTTTRGCVVVHPLVPYILARCESEDLRRRRVVYKGDFVTGFLFHEVRKDRAERRRKPRHNTVPCASSFAFVTGKQCICIYKCETCRENPNPINGGAGFTMFLYYNSDAGAG